MMAVCFFPSHLNTTANPEINFTLANKPSQYDTVMRRITTFRSTTDGIYDGGPIQL